ncbi:3-oxoacyl-ACP synthase [Nubsella zeaxanthinifaciens]|uniref:3-oxoacyl-ACP synthase n=1 Tax=Nubsella zeaxanthinifaciens TaxID=392412 RepID=UPI000DE4815C|nr:3-oxoacyl-ACP synthase [Nubsella zeaxanthinifaciens]
MKNQLYELCLKFIDQRIANATEALQQAQEASNDDIKSSAGDKFETGREMAQQDINRNKQLLADAQQQKSVLLSLADVAETEKVRAGSLVYTNNGNFYISISAGQLTLNNQPYFAVSAASPIGKLLIGKAKGEAFDFNGKKYKIDSIS